jgi:predicted ester cyclase
MNRRAPVNPWACSRKGTCHPAVRRHRVRGSRGSGVTARHLNTGRHMHSAANKEVVRRFVAEVVNTGDVSRVEDFIGPDYVDHYAGEDAPIGPGIMAEHIRAVRATYPDLHVTIEQQFADGDFVISRVLASGTHQGTWLGLAPTGKRVRIAVVNIDRVRNGRIVEHWGMANTLEALVESGILRPPLAPTPPLETGF